MSPLTINAVNHLRLLLLDEKFLYVGNPVDEKVLLCFLQFTDFDICKAFEKMKTFYKDKESYSEFYAFKRDPNLHDVILKKGINTMLEHRDPLGRRIFVYTLGNLVYGAHEVHEMFQVDDLWLRVACEEEETQKNGLVLLFNLENLQWKFLSKFTPYNIRAATTKAENLPIKNIQYHVVNYGRAIGILVSLVFPFLKEETKSKVYFHPSMERLHAHVSPSALPQEYGGDRPSPVQAKRIREYLDPQNSRLAGESHLYLGKPTDELLLREFLIFTDFNIDKAFEKIKLWFRLKAENSQFYAFKRDPKVHDVILKEKIHIMLPDRDQLGRRLYLFKLGNLIYGAHEPYEMFQVDDLWITLALQEEETQKNGLVFLFDMENFPWRFLRHFTPHIIKASTAKAENIPSKHIQYHVIKAGWWVNTIVQLVFPFLSQATKEQIFFHKNQESLHSHISPDVLPQDYGGTKPLLDSAELVKAYLDPKTDRLNELLSYRYTEKPTV